MEIEAEHYTNGVVEGSSARIMNGTYKHEEILQPDDNSIGNGVAGTYTHGPTLHSACSCFDHLCFPLLKSSVCAVRRTFLLAFFFFFAFSHHIFNTFEFGQVCFQGPV